MATEREQTRAELRRVYGTLASDAERTGGGSGCCSPAGDIAESLPEGEASCLAELGPGLGCGDPVTLARLRPGEAVLDLGSGGGLDCFRAAAEVGESGRVIGVDMTPEMISRARANLEKLEADNVEFRLGEIEHLPLAEESVDVVISNCVLNLAPDRDRVFQEAYRVLQPGGRLAICDVLMDKPLPAALLQQLPDGGAGVQGLADEVQYVEAMRSAGFVQVQVEREYIGASEPLEAPSGTRAQLMVQTAETGETLANLDLDSVDLATVPRSFNGSITAIKPTGTGSV